MGFYTDVMNALRAELHELVDRLSPAQLRPVLTLIQGRVEETERKPRRLSFSGAMSSGVGDLAEQSTNIVREEMGRSL